jgi:hypothetical protein
VATGRDVQLTRQIGEYLVCAELGRRGWIATTFTGSVPGFDILAANPIASAARICVFVVVKGTGHDEFYVFPWEDLQDILLQGRRAAEES